MRRLLDMLHELRIQLALWRLLRRPTRGNTQRFNNLIRARSQEQVARMESKFSNGQGGTPAGRFKPVQPARPNTTA